MSMTRMTRRQASRPLKWSAPLTMTRADPRTQLVRKHLVQTGAEDAHRQILLGEILLAVPLCPLEELQHDGTFAAEVHLRRGLPGHAALGALEAHVRALADLVVVQGLVGIALTLKKSQPAGLDEAAWVEGPIIGVGRRKRRRVRAESRDQRNS